VGSQATPVLRRRRALTCRRRPDHIREVLRAYANVHVMFNSLVISALCSALHVVAVLLFLGVDSPSAVVMLAELLVRLMPSCCLVGEVDTRAIRTHCLHQSSSSRAGLEFT
jgi:hypothetical protein